MGVSPDSRRNERLLVEAPSLQLQFSVPASSVEDIPDHRKRGGKLPRRWVDEHLHLPPMGGDVGARDICQSSSTSSQGVGRGLGRCAVQARGKPPSSLAKEQRAHLTSDPEASFIPHEEGRVYLLFSGHRALPEQPVEVDLPDSRQRPTTKEIIDVYQA